MKNIIITTMLILVVSLLVSHAISLENDLSSGNQQRNTDGTLSFSVRTATYNGQYAPRNSGAIWITNSANQFVKTIKVWANPYRWTLIRWNASSGGNTTGAITGASLNNHQLHNITWNGANNQGTQQPDGDYKINIEFTEHNATASNMGKYKQITFTKGPTAVNQTIPNETYFRDMTLVWTPVVVNGSVFGTVVDGAGLPVSGATVQAGAFSVTTGVNGAYDIVLAPATWSMTCSAPGHTPQTVDNVVVGSGQAVEQNFVLSVVSNSDDLNSQALFQLMPPRPNPAVNQAKISYTTESSQAVQLSIFNMRGQKVFENTITSCKAGINEAIWNGKDQFGQRCPSGNYLVRIMQEGRIRTQKLQLAQ